MKKLYTRREAAGYLSISLRTLDRRTCEGKIAYVSAGPGCRVMYTQRALDDYIRRNTHRANR